MSNLRNTEPIYSGKPLNDWYTGAITAANTARDGTGTVYLVFEAPVTYGGILEKLSASSLGNNVASLLRVFLNNGQDPTTAANNHLLREIDLPATSASETISIPAIESIFDQPMEPGFRIYVALATAVATGWVVSCHGGSYEPA